MRPSSFLNVRRNHTGQQQSRFRDTTGMHRRDILRRGERVTGRRAPLKEVRLSSGMTKRMFKLLFGAAAGVGLATSTAFGQAPPAEPTREELLRRIEELQSRVNEIEQNIKRTSDLTAEQVDATVSAVLRDADHRSQLPQPGGFTAGYSDGKFLIRSEDGAFVLHPY